MGSGKKNYFRHSINAIDDEKIQLAVETLGLVGYAYFFVLVELVARQISDGDVKPVRIHKHTLQGHFRKRFNGCKKILENLKDCGLLDFEETNGILEVEIKNLAKYLGRYNKDTKKKAPAINQKKKRAKELADLIESSLSKFGNSQSDKEARSEMLGEDGLAVCRSLGGWSQLAFSNTMSRGALIKKLTDASYDHISKKEVVNEESKND